MLLFYLPVSSIGIEYLGCADAAANKKRFEVGRDEGKIERWKPEFSWEKNTYLYLGFVSP